MSTVTQSRAETLAAIAEYEAKLIELRASLPSSIQRFFRFRCRPPRHVMVYAADREAANAKLAARMDKDYPPNELNQPTWQLTSGVVDVYNDPAIAANHCSGSLLRSLTPEDAAEFCRNFRENEQGRAVDPDRPKHLPKSQLLQDIENYEKRMREQK